ncbi:hypothetical protein JL720_16064 [Aureococcus anophagefferens]|nr:hypothetical protein JL720_16064 [Aureococcus anophagefferens]
MSSPRYVPVDFLAVRARASTLDEALDAMRWADRVCTLTSVQSDRVKRSGFLKRALTRVFTRVLPVPRPRGALADRARPCLWADEDILYGQQLDGLILLQRLVEHFAATRSPSIRRRRVADRRPGRRRGRRRRARAPRGPRRAELPEPDAVRRRGRSLGFGISSGPLALQSATIEARDPHLSVARTSVLDYFAAGGPREDHVLGHGPVAPANLDGMLRSLCGELAWNPSPSILPYYATAPNLLLAKNCPEWACYRDVAFYFKYFMNTSAAFGAPASDDAYTQRMAHLSWSYDEAQHRFVVAAFSSRWPARRRARRASVEAAPGPTARRRTPSLTEDDVLHVKQLPSFGDALGQHDSELLLSYLTVPYIRLPLVLRRADVCEAILRVTAGSGQRLVARRQRRRAQRKWAAVAEPKHLRPGYVSARFTLSPTPGAPGDEPIEYVDRRDDRGRKGDAHRVMLDLQAGLLTVGTMHLRALSAAHAAHPDVVATVGTQAVQAATVSSATNREWLRLVSSSLELQIWTTPDARPLAPHPPGLLREYAPDALEKDEYWLLPLVEPLRLAYFNDPRDPVDNLSSILAWAARRRDEPDAEPTYAISVVELPRLKLSFAELAGLYSLDHAQLAISNVSSDDQVADPRPAPLLLANANDELTVLLPSVRVTRPALGVFSTALVVDRRTRPVGARRAWGAALKDGFYYLYDAHVSLGYLICPTLAASLYLLLLRFLSRDYARCFQLRARRRRLRAPEELRLLKRFAVVDASKHSVAGGGDPQRREHLAALRVGRASPTFAASLSPKRRRTGAEDVLGSTHGRGFLYLYSLLAGGASVGVFGGSASWSTRRRRRRSSYSRGATSWDLDFDDYDADLDAWDDRRWRRPAAPAAPAGGPGRASRCSLENVAGPSPVASILATLASYPELVPGLPEWRKPSAGGAKTKGGGAVGDSAAVFSGATRAPWRPGAVQDGSVVAVFAGAAWDPESRLAVGALKTLHEKLRREGGDGSFEIIFASLDQSEAEMAEFFVADHGDWLCLKYGDKAAADRLFGLWKPGGAPALLLLDATDGSVLCEDGFAALRKDPTAEKFPWCDRKRFSLASLRNQRALGLVDDGDGDRATIRAPPTAQAARRDERVPSLRCLDDRALAGICGGDDAVGGVHRDHGVREVGQLVADLEGSRARTSSSWRARRLARFAANRLDAGDGDGDEAMGRGPRDVAQAARIRRQRRATVGEEFLYSCLLSSEAPRT